MTSFTPENETPDRFDFNNDGSHPQRKLTNFAVTRADQMVSICALDDAKDTDAPVVARGTVIAPDGDEINVVSAPLTEWCIDYGSPPLLWVRTQHVWYRLEDPAKEYEKIHETARRRFELCSRIYILGTTTDTKTCTYKLFIQLLFGSYGKMRGYTEKELLLEKDFILAQLKNLGSSRLTNMPFVKTLRDKKGVPSKKNANGSKKKEKESANGAPASNPTAAMRAWQPSGKLDTEGNSRLMKRVEKLINSILKNKVAWPFTKPVDPERDGCPDYLDRVKKPMDYGTIKARCEKNFYGSPSAVAKDVRQIALNCREYNGDHHDFSIWVIDLERKFETQMANAEDAELAAMAKRNSNKKRKISDALPPSGKNSSKKGSKAAKKGSKSSSPDVSPVGTPSKDDEPVTQKLCARSADQAQSCSKMQISGSKYCSDACGLIVARARIQELGKAGHSVDDYITQSVTKALVHSRS